MLVLILCTMHDALFLLELWNTCNHVVFDLVDDCGVYVQLCDIGCTRICNCRQLFRFTSMMGGASLVNVDIDLSSWTLLLVIDSLESFMFYLLPNLSAQLLSY